MKKKHLKIPKDLQVKILNKNQRWWANIRDNCEITIRNFKDSIKLQEHILIMAKDEIVRLK